LKRVFDQDDYRAKRLAVCDTLAAEHKAARDAAVEATGFLLPQLLRIVCSFSDNAQEAHLKLVLDWGKEARLTPQHGDVCPFHLCPQIRLVDKLLEDGDGSVVCIDVGSSTLKAGSACTTPVSCLVTTRYRDCARSRFFWPAFCDVFLQILLGDVQDEGEHLGWCHQAPGSQCSARRASG
jgi:hypothetical protein